MSRFTYERIDLLLRRRGMSRRKLAIAAGIPASSLQSAMARMTKKEGERNDLL